MGETVDVPQFSSRLGALSAFGRPTAVVCDRFRLNELLEGRAGQQQAYIRALS